MAATSLLKLVVLLSALDMAVQQRVAPGVPPQQYQQPPPPNYQHHQHQQQQQQFQQVPQQGVNMNQGVPVQVQHAQHQGMQGQVPVQHGGHGQQVPAQPPPPHQQGLPPPNHGQPPQGHHHGHHGGPPQQLLDASNVAKEREHIQEHMDVPIDTSQMSEQELQFHYFKMHDADNNNKLDGCELVKSLIHWHDQANHDPRGGQPIPEAKVFNDEELTNMIDPILANDDINKDGFIDYGEFVRAQASAANRASQHAA